jgi:phosphoribosylamine---glycine ligase
MRVLVLGSGGREHALAWRIAGSPGVRAVFCAPGNPGMQSSATCVDLSPTDIPSVLRWTKENAIDLTVVGPEQPLAAGIVDRMREEGAAVFGPTRDAAELEWSKAYSKDFMKRHGIPTAHYRTFPVTQREEAFAYITRGAFPVVLKADGLAAGKGVLLCASLEEAHATFESMSASFGKAGDTVVIEEFMQGEEASVLAVTDGENFVTLAPAQDHKRVADGDRGKNTGGMGAYAPAPVVTETILSRVRSTIIEPTLKGMREEGRPFTGCLYVGLMLTAEGPKVVEYNCRFGDPEAQVVLPLFQGDFAGLLMAASRGKMSAWKAQEQPPGQHAVCVVLASGGYPDKYETGKEIRGLETLDARPDVKVFHAGTTSTANRLVTSGGRVLGVTAFGITESLASTIERAYGAVASIHFNGMFFRRDIGHKGLRRSK